MIKVAVGLAGRIGSGKTTLTSALANRIGCPRASFGGYVRSVARVRGLDSRDRTVLQDLGDELISEGWDAFVEHVLQHARYVSGSVVIDGIRHRPAVDTLRKRLRPTQLVLVALNISDEERRKRLRDQGLNTDEVTLADTHANEAEVDGVMRGADIVIPADLTVERACTTVLAWISRNVA